MIFSIVPYTLSSTSMCSAPLASPLFYLHMQCTPRLSMVLPSCSVRPSLLHVLPSRTVCPSPLHGSTSMPLCDPCLSKVPIFIPHQCLLFFPCWPPLLGAFSVLAWSSLSSLVALLLPLLVFNLFYQLKGEGLTFNDLFLNASSPQEAIVYFFGRHLFYFFTCKSSPLCNFTPNLKHCHYCFTFE